MLWILLCLIVASFCYGFSVTSRAYVVMIVGNLFIITAFSMNLLCPLQMCSPIPVVVTIPLLLGMICGSAVHSR